MIKVLPSSLSRPLPANPPVKFSNQLVINSLRNPRVQTSSSVLCRYGMHNEVYFQHCQGTIPYDLVSQLIAIISTTNVSSLPANGWLAFKITVSSSILSTVTDICCPSFCAT